MNKTIYRIMGIIVTFALIMGGFSNAEAVSDQSAVANATSSKPVYAYYYLWWSTRHWQDKLGSNYPYSASPLPLPAKTDADGCNPVSNYAGNQLLDIPTRLVSQDEPGAIEEDIRLAKNAGLTGFWLNWGGDGTTTQTRTSVSYTRRLAEAFAASKRVGGFKNWVSYKAAAREPAKYIINDLNFLYKEFKGETAWEKIDGKPVVTFTGSRAYSDADVQKISNAVRDRMYLVGDESRKTLTSARMKMFDAITYYWSTQDPYGNPQSFDQIREMGDKVHAAGKRWYAPLNPGYNSVLLKTGSCIPRKNGETLRAVWNGNLKSNPDGWGFISWNEIAENSHIKPMQKWGSKYLNILSALIGASSMPVPTLKLGKYDDWHDGLTYRGFVRSSPVTGPYQEAFQYSTVVGSDAEFKFSGSQITLTYTKYYKYGDLEVYVDDELKGTISQYDADRVWLAEWTSGDLGAGEHTVRLVHAGPSSKIVNVDAIEVKTYVAPTPQGTGTYDNEHAGWTYSGFVRSSPVTGPYLGTFHYSTVVGGTAEFAIDGSEITLTYTKYYKYGDLEVYVDDVLKATLDQYDPARVWLAEWTSGDLGAGEHTVRLVHAGPSGKIVNIDAIEIATLLSSSPPTPALAVTGTFDDKKATFDYSSSAWQDKSTDKAYGGSYKETTKSGSFVTLAFSGQSFSIVYKGGVTYGKMKVYVDDTLVTTLDQKLSTETHQKRWDYPEQLASGNHTLKLVFEPVSETISKGSLDAVIIR